VVLLKLAAYDADARIGRAEVKFALRRTAGLGALALAASLIVAPAADGLKIASPPRLAPPSPPLQKVSSHRSVLPSTGFHVRGSNGYRILVDGEPKGAVSHHAEVFVLVETDGAVADYSVRGEVTSNRIKAHVGALGSIDMRFHRRKGSRRYRIPCAGNRNKGEWGIWRGKINFTGESGYTAVSARRAKPIWLFQTNGCSDVETGSGIRGVWLSNISGQTFFDAYQNKGPGTRVQFDATDFEHTDGVDIVRQVWTPGSPKTFRYNKRLTKATATPPAPFGGSVSFTRKRHSRKGILKGDLTATFPGTGPIGLVGVKNDARLRHAIVTIRR
jgi:hypothetical protein